MRTDVATISASATIAQCRSEYLLGSRHAVIAVDDLKRYCGIVLLPELFSGELDSIADEIQVIELIKFQDVTLFPAMNVKSAMKVFDDVGAEVLAVTEAGGSRKVIGLLTESYARRRYAEELDQATRGLLGQV